MAHRAQGNPEQPDLRAVKAAAKSRFGGVRGVQGFGIGDGSLRVYIRTPEVRKRLPNKFQGVPVDFVVVGDIVAG
jgi:hypothetical protein